MAGQIEPVLRVGVGIGVAVGTGIDRINSGSRVYGPVVFLNADTGRVSDPDPEAQARPPGSDLAGHQNVTMITKARGLCAGCVK